MKNKRYSWHLTIGWTIEFVRKDAEVYIRYDGRIGDQRVVAKACGDTDKAEQQASAAAEALYNKVVALLNSEMAKWPKAKE